MLVEAWQFVLQHPDRFFAALLRHVELSAAALAIAIAIAVPAGIAFAAKPRAALAAITVANIGRTLPSLAVLALVMPILGTGFAPSLFALALLGLPPSEIQRGVEIPIATPVIFAGIRTAAVQVVSGAVLAAYIGGGGLGDFITAGIAMMALPQLFVGAIPATLLSIGTDQLFGYLQRTFTPPGLRAA
jgi:osmoprotectant transport system permease protein